MKKLTFVIVAAILLAFIAIVPNWIVMLALGNLGLTHMGFWSCVPVTIILSGLVAPRK